MHCTGASHNNLGLILQSAEESNKKNNLFLNDTVSITDRLNASLSSSSSLAREHFKFGLGCPRVRCPVCSVPHSSSISLRNQVHVNIIHHKLGLRTFSLSSILVFQYVLQCSFTFHSYNLPKPCQSSLCSLIMLQYLEI